MAGNSETEATTLTRNATAQPVPRTTLTALIEAQMRATPDAPALVFGDTRLSYAELDTLSAALARRLASRGIGPGAVVGVALPRSVALIVALLGVLRAGAAYVPLDPDYLYRSCKYVDKTYRLFEKHFEVSIKLMPLDWWNNYWESIPIEEDVK